MGGICMSDLLELYNESWSEEFNVDVDASKSMKVHVAPKTYAMLVQIGVFNIHSRGIADWVSKVDVEAIYMNLDFSVDMLLQNYQAIKMAVMLKEYPFDRGYQQQADKIWNNILQHLSEFNPEDAEELRNKLFKRRVA
jgi:hypothetical protein